MLSPRDDYVDNKREKQNKGRGEEVERVFIFSSLDGGTWWFLYWPV